jgi:RNA polymerase sigma-70 factor (ECF subfamily)
VREPEPETIRRARQGDLGAFEALVRAYQADAWRFAYHLTGNRTIAEDVTQEAFLRAFRAMGTYKGEAKFTNWLLRIVRNCAVDLYRKQRRETAVPMGGGTPESQDRPAPAPLPEDRLRIDQAIRQLPLELREPFVTIEVCGFDYQEASTILGVKVGTLKSRMHRARAALMRALVDEEAAGEV